MNLNDIPLIRLASQHVGGEELTSPNAIVSWMLAMQAQDFPMAKWAIGVRLPGSTDRLVDAAIDEAAILRTHLLRPTWHFVCPEDIHWLLELSAPQIQISMRARDKVLELTEAVYSKSNKTIEKALTKQGQLSREALILELNHAGIPTDQNRASHLLMRAELEKIICSGAILRGKPTYALLAERVSRPRLLVKEEALAELASRYFTSRGPATLQDFIWWSGLPARLARQALEIVISNLLSEVVDGIAYWLPRNYNIPAPVQATTLLLPTYDEFIISYSDRTASIPSMLEQHLKAISDRGVFWPILVENGLVKGIWKRSIKKDIINVEVQLFSKPDSASFEFIKDSARHFADFWGKQLEFLPPSQLI